MIEAVEGERVQWQQVDAENPEKTRNCVGCVMRADGERVYLDENCAEILVKSHPDGKLYFVPHGSQSKYPAAPIEEPSK